MDPDFAELDDRLIERAVSGDAESQRALWAMHRRWVAGVILAHKPRSADLDDLLQEVALAFVRTLSGLKDPRALRPWLRTIAINAARYAGRKQSRRRERIVSDDVAGQFLAEGRSAPDPSAQRASIESSAGLMRLAERLPDGYREPLILKCVRGMSYRSISAVMGVPETTVETRIARARRMLRELASQEAESFQFEGARATDSPAHGISV